MDLADALLQLHPGDPVALARRELAPGTELEGAGRRITVRDPVPHGHKLALVDIAAGEQVLKYGQPIGIATRRSRPASTCTSTTCARSRARGSRCPRRRRAPRGATAAGAPDARRARPRPPRHPHLRRDRPPRRPRRHPQLRRRAQLGQLLGHRGQADRRRVLGARRAGRASRRRRRDRGHPRQRLRALARRRGAGGAAPHPRRLRPPSQRRRRRRRRARLRGQPDLGARRRVRPPRGHCRCAASSSRSWADRWRPCAAASSSSASCCREAAAPRQPVPASELMLGPQLRRLGRLVGGHRQPGAGRRRRPAGRRRRHRDPRRDARRSTAPSTC